MERTGSSVAEVAYPGDRRKALIDRRREVICRRLNWAAVVRAQCRDKEEEGEDIEMKYDVGVSSKSI